MDSDILDYDFIINSILPLRWLWLIAEKFLINCTNLPNPVILTSDNNQKFTNEGIEPIHQSIILAYKIQNHVIIITDSILRKLHSSALNLQ